MNTPLTLSAPAFIDLNVPGGPSVPVDVYEARRMLDDAGRQPNEAARQGAILKYLADKLTVDRNTLAENMALEFNDAVVRIVARLNEERQKKTSRTANWQPPTPESPPTTDPGP